MVFVSAGVAGPRPSKASEESVLTTSDRCRVLKVGVSAACAPGPAERMSADKSSRFTGSHRFGERSFDTSEHSADGPRASGDRPTLSCSIRADDLAGVGVNAQPDLVAGCVVRLGLPHAVVEIDVVHMRVTLGFQRGFHVMLAQCRHLFIRVHLAGAGIDANVHMVAIGALRLGMPHAVLELQVVHLGVALLGELAVHLRFGQCLLRHPGICPGRTIAARRNSLGQRSCGWIRLRGSDRVDQTAASFSFFSGRTFTFTVAGLAANTCSRPVNGFLPLRFGLAGTFTALILNRPGRVNWPTPFLCTDASTADSRPASTALTAFASTLAWAAIWAISPDFDKASFSGFTGAAALAGAFLAGAFLAVVLVAMDFISIVGNSVLEGLGGLAARTM